MERNRREKCVSVVRCVRCWRSVRWCNAHFRLSDRLGSLTESTTRIQVLLRKCKQSRCARARLLLKPIYFHAISTHTDTRHIWDDESAYVPNTFMYWVLGTCMNKNEYIYVMKSLQCTRNAVGSFNCLWRLIYPTISMFRFGRTDSGDRRENDSRFAHRDVTLEREEENLELWPTQYRSINWSVSEIQQWSDHSASLLLSTLNTYQHILERFHLSCLFISIVSVNQQ